MKSNRRFWQSALRRIPGGVNSPVRSFKGVGGIPIFFKRGKGAYLESVEGRKYIDYCMSWGALILGHAHPEVVKAITQAAQSGTSFGACTPLEVELAERIIRFFPSIQKVRLVNSGTEAVMSALRLARAFTHREGILKFDGCYHGHADSLLVKAGSGVMTLGIASSTGIPHSFIAKTHSIPYNDLATTRKFLLRYGKKIAAVIVEPIAANMGLVLADTDFLHGLRKVTEKIGALLIFDEVVTGFRTAPGGAQELYQIKPDLTTLGKILGGGLPIGALGGRAEIMDQLAPLGSVYQAGTLSGNPMAVTAGLSTLRQLSKTLYSSLEKKTELLASELEKIATEKGIDLKCPRIGSMMGCRFSNTGLYRTFFHHLLREGVYLPPSPFETLFLSVAHTDSEIQKTINAFERGDFRRDYNNTKTF